MPAPISLVSACMRSWFGPTKHAPISTGTPGPEVRVHTRPPTRSLASRTTRAACLDSRRAAVSPASPAPTTQMSASIGTALLALVLAMAATSREGNMRAARM